MKRFLFLSLTVPLALGAMEPLPKKRSLVMSPLDQTSVVLSKPYLTDQPDMIQIDARTNQKVVGRIQFMKAGSMGKICLIKVVESHRKRGIGFELFKTAILELQERGCDTIIWDAITGPHGNIEELKSIYTRMVAKLQEDAPGDFFCGQIHKTSDLQSLLMKFTLKKLNKKMLIGKIKK